MKKKNDSKKAPSNSNKKIQFNGNKKRKKGFTLLEFIILLIVLGVLVAFGIIIGLNKYDNESKRSYVDLAKDIINEAKKKINLGNYEAFDVDTTYYIDSSCIKTKNLPQTTYGDISKAYVVVTFNGKNHIYYWTSVNTTGYGIKNIIRFDKLSNDSVENGLVDNDITLNRGIDGRKKIMIVNKQNNCDKKVEGQVEVQVSGETGEIIG